MHNAGRKPRIMRANGRRGLLDGTFERKKFRRNLKDVSTTAVGFGDHLISHISVRGGFNPLAYDDDTSYVSQAKSQQ